MNNKLTTYINHHLECQVRTVELDGKPWLVGKDVAAALGYKNPQKALRDHVYAEDKTVNVAFTVNGTAATLINESGMYALIFGSQMPIAQEFKHWVTSEVLPAIRQTGGYQRTITQAEILAGQAQLLVTIERRQAEMEALQEQHTQQIAAIGEASTIGNDSNWREDCNHIIRSYALRELNGDFREAYIIVKNELEKRAHCRINQRKKNMQRRMRACGVSKTRIDKLANVDVIAADPRLTEIYIAICRELAILSACEPVA